MRILRSLALATLIATAAAVVTGPILAGDAWHKDLETGISAARKSGRPILVVTAWKSGI